MCLVDGSSVFCYRPTILPWAVSLSACLLQNTQDMAARAGKHARSASHPGDMQQALLGDTEDYPRSASHAYASTRGSAFSPSSDFVGRVASGQVL